jgi:Spy/CpxP family protein refolding chaperone
MGNTWKVVVAFVGVFVAGTVFGGFFALGVGQRVMQSRTAPRPPADPMLLKRYVDRLELTEAQTTKIKPILDKIQSDVDEISRQARTETAATIRPIVEKAEANIKKILNSEQVAKLAELQKRRDLALPGQDGRGGSRGGPPGSFQNRGGGGPNPFNGPGQGGRGGGERAPGGGGRSGGFVPQSATDPKTAPATPTAPAPTGN